MTDAPHKPEREYINHAGATILCPVAAHPKIDEIRVHIANGQSLTWIADQYGIPAGHVEGRENEHNRGPEPDEFLRRYKARHPWASVHSVDQARELEKAIGPRPPHER